MKVPSLIEKAFLLKKTELFEETSLDTLLAITDKLDSMPIKENQLIFQKGQTPKYLYLILEGEVSIGSESETTQTLHSGALLGEVELLSSDPYTQNATCVRPGFLLAFTKKHLLSIFSECPDIALKLLAQLALQMRKSM